MQNGLSNQNGFIKNNINNGYVYHEDLSDIDEEDEKQEDENNFRKICYPELKTNKNFQQDTLNESISSLENGTDIVDNLETYDNGDYIDGNNTVLRVHSLFEKHNLKKILSTGTSKENKSLPTKLLCPKATLSAMIDIDVKEHSHVPLDLIRPSPFTPHSSTQSLASSQIDLSLTNQSKSNLRGSHLSSSSTFLFSKVQKSHKSNSLIVRTKARISLLENTALYNPEPRKPLNENTGSKPSSRMKNDRKHQQKSQTTSKFFNQNFKLDFS